MVECGDYVVLLWEKFNQQPFVKMLKELVRWFSPLRLGGMGWTIILAGTLCLPGVRGGGLRKGGRASSVLNGSVLPGFAF